MVMRKAMKVEEAYALAQQIKHGFKKYGAQFSPMASPSSLAEAVSVLYDAIALDAVPATEHEKVKAELRAATAREGALRKQLANSTPVA
jgi:hypothetical protein